MLIDISERKRAEADLAERQAQLAVFVEHAPASIAVFDREMRYVAVSRRFLTDYRLPPDAQLIGRSHYEVFPEIPERWRDIHTRVLAGEELSNEEDQFTRQDGRTDWVRWSMTPWRGGDGRIGGAVLFAEVRTEQVEARRAREQAEQALAERNIQLALAAKAGLVGTFAYDADTEIMYISDGYAAIHGFPEGTTEIARSECLAGVHPDDIGRVEQFRSEAFRERRHEYNVEYRIIRPGGELRWVETRCFLSFSGEGHPHRVVGVSIDITERKKAELALAERDALIGLAEKVTRVGNYAVDINTGRVQPSAGCVAIHGFPEGTAEIWRDDWRAGVHRDDLAHFDRLFGQAFAERWPEYKSDYRIIRSDGEVRWIEERAVIAYDRNGRPERLVGVNIDVTERKRAEEHQGVLMAELDHRVKNVLATVQAVAAQTMQASSSMEHFVAALYGRIRSMGSTHELLSHRRWLGIPLGELVERELAPYATGSNIMISGPDVMLSPEAAQTMAMVLHELATNAAKHGSFSTRDGHVSVRWHRELNGDADAALRIEWQESGGPAVVQAPDRRSGYGMEIIRDLLPYELDGTVDLAFASEGVRCRFDIPVAQLTSGDQAHLFQSISVPEVRKSTKRAE